MDYQGYLTRPFQDPGWLPKLLIGTLLTIVPIVNLLVLGYGIACIRGGIRGTAYLPDWRAWQYHLQNGLTALVITAAYFLVPALIALVFALIPVIGMIVSAVLGLLAGFVVPMALAAYTATGQISSAWRIDEIVLRLERCLDIYAPAYLFVVLGLVLASVIITFIPHLALLGFFIIFYLMVVFSFMLGDLYASR